MEFRSLHRFHDLIRYRQPPLPGINPFGSEASGVFRKCEGLNESQNIHLIFAVFHEKALNLEWSR